MAIAQSIIDRVLNTQQGTAAYQICEKLLDNNFEAYWVGGCIRDMLLEHIPDDIDIATNATPQEISTLFPKCDTSSSNLGATLVSHLGVLFEITTYRKEDECSDGRFPESIEYTNKYEDSKRRDITINAMYWNPISSELFDPHNGIQDLQERLVRIIGDPVTRIEHDALRLLRVVRFRAQIEGQYHPETFQALHDCANKVEVLSGTRILLELQKTLLGKHPDRAFEDLWETDVLQYTVPELHACKGVAQPNPPHSEGDVWNHTMKAISSFTEDHKIDVRWATLFHDVGKPKTFSIDAERIKFNEHAKVGGKIANKVFERLNMPKKQREKICWLIEHHMMMRTFFEIDNSRKAHWYYHPWFVDLLQLFWLDIAGTGEKSFELYERIINDYNHFLDEHPRPQKPLLTGEEVMEILDIPQGERIGKLLHDLHIQQVQKAVTTKKEAIAYIASLKGH